jgi:hypothetical protein
VQARKSRKAAAPAARAAATGADATGAQDAVAAVTQRLAADVHAALADDTDDDTQSDDSEPCETAGAPADAASGRATPVPQPPRSRGNGSKGSSRGNGSSRARQGHKQRSLLGISGAWWPQTFGPADLAVTAHFWSTLLGWHLAIW